MPKGEKARLFLEPEELRRLIADDRLCYVSGAILEEGRQVGYMVRQVPVFPADSGWRFFAGGEPGGRLRDGASGFYPLNTLCNYDRQVIPLLDAPTGSAFARVGAALTPLVPASAGGISRGITGSAESPAKRKAPVRRGPAAGNGRKVKVRRLCRKARKAAKGFISRPSPTKYRRGQISAKQRKSEQTGGKSSLDKTFAGFFEK